MSEYIDGRDSAVGLTRDKAIIHFYERSWDSNSIAWEVDCSQRTVQRVIKKYKEEQEQVRQANDVLDETNFWKAQHDKSEQTNALQNQIDGDHYKKLKIQPVEYIHGNNIGFSEGNAITYLTRWRDKGGIKDLEKAIHTIQLLIELENKETV